MSAWLVAAGPIGHPVTRQRYAAYASGLAIMSVLVLVLRWTSAVAGLAGAPLLLALILAAAPAILGRWGLLRT